MSNCLSKCFTSPEILTLTFNEITALRVSLEKNDYQSALQSLLVYWANYNKYTKNDKAILDEIMSKNGK